MTRLLCVIALVTACGGRPSAPAHPDTNVSGGSAATTNQPTTTTHTDERSNHDCAHLAEHVVELANAERPPEHKLTADERGQLASQLHERWVASCKAMTRDGYLCAVQSRTLAQLEACGG